MSKVCGARAVAHEVGRVAAGCRSVPLATRVPNSRRASITDEESWSLWRATRLSRLVTYIFQLVRVRDQERIRHGERFLGSSTLLKGLF